MGQSKSLMEKKSPNRFWTEAYEQKYVSAELLKLLRESREMEKLNKMERPVLLQGKEFAPYMTGNIVQKRKAAGKHLRLSGFAGRWSRRMRISCSRSFLSWPAAWKGEKRRYSAPSCQRNSSTCGMCWTGGIQSADAIGKR